MQTVTLEDKQRPVEGVTTMRVAITGASGLIGTALAAGKGSVGKQRSTDGRAAEDDKQQDGRERLAPEGEPQQEQARGDGHQRRQADGPAHLARCDQPGLHGALWPTALNVVGAVERVTVVVGQIGQDLQQDGRDDAQQGHQPVERALGRGQPRAGDDAGQGQRQRARADALRLASPTYRMRVTRTTCCTA